jgi:hypothetical protein
VLVVDKILSTFFHKIPLLSSCCLKTSFSCLRTSTWFCNFSFSNNILSAFAAFSLNDWLECLISVTYSQALARIPPLLNVLCFGGPASGLNRSGMSLPNYTVNTMTVKLGKLIPDLFNPEAGPPKHNTLSKGGILARACEYVTEIRHSNQSLREKAAKADKILLENEKLQNQVEVLKQENEVLRQQLESNGILWKKVDNILSTTNTS